MFTARSCNAAATLCWNMCLSTESQGASLHTRNIVHTVAIRDPDSSTICLVLFNFLAWDCAVRFGRFLAFCDACAMDPQSQ